jgi:hypothetical protein
MLAKSRGVNDIVEVARCTPKMKYMSFLCDLLDLVSCECFIYPSPVYNLKDWEKIQPHAFISPGTPHSWFHNKNYVYISDVCHPIDKTKAPMPRIRDIESAQQTM